MCGCELVILAGEATEYPRHSHDGEHDYSWRKIMLDRLRLILAGKYAHRPIGQLPFLAHRKPVVETERGEHLVAALADVGALVFFAARAAAFYKDDMAAETRGNDMLFA
jgi:hypothetical protein